MHFPAVKITKRLSCLLAGFTLLLGMSSASPGQTKTVTFSPDTHPPKRETPLLIGANTHFGTGHVYGYTSAEVGLEQLHVIGANSFRDYLPWQSFDNTANGAVLRKSERLMKFLPQAAGLRPLINVGLTNPAVPGGVPPLSDEALRSFESYLDKATDVMAPYKPIYEIWNEWNIGIGTGVEMPRLADAGPASDPRAAVHYVRVAKAAVREIRRQSPGATILVGAVGDDPQWAWARAIVREGALDGADGLSIHLYNHCLNASKRTANELVERAKALQAALKDIRGGRMTPIYVTEFGWPTHQGKCSVDPDDAAVNFSQFILQASSLPWIKGIWQHELKNIGTDATDPENNFGLFTYDNKPKPGACFVREAIAIVRDADFVEVERPFPTVFLVRARQQSRQTIALWTSADAGGTRFSLSGASGGKLMCDRLVNPGTAPGELGRVPIVYTADSSATIRIKVEQ
jgi:hypothetical protein